VKVMVTGATTPIGIALVEAFLAERDERVLAVGFDDRVRNLPADPRLVYQHVDLTRPRGVHDLVWGRARALGIECVVHGALHRRARDGGRHVHAQNVEATRQLLLACEEHPSIRLFVFRSTADVYAVRDAEPTILDEDAPLELDPSAPQWVRDRVEADLTVCTHMGMSTMRIAVLRCAEILAPGIGSQLWDYLQSRVCLRPLGFDPMINVLSLADVVRAIVLAARTDAEGIFNIPGRDTLPLSALIRGAHCLGIAVPGPALAPLYDLRAWVRGLDFRYDQNLRRFHFGGVVDGRRATRLLGFRPHVPA
jgi:UDP-glucose 4-epimerase